ncbi:hypothetical protein FB45DRAFT_898651 [Roridomyces roridus]|uniref:Major facilitator superfamily (MFS) profile domain-containing protein n=1 Tax=Roridomyces roridus TaxID=1738132 RepID=A0AAD7CCS2_9AGAR|nr:hypothetical protein FB45DRAFT_898651 [Roridomyces roridus]
MSESLKNGKDTSSVEHTEYYNEDNGADLSNNVNAKIKNPLKGIPKEKLFAQAALVAQNPVDFDTIQELTDEDRHLLRREVTHKWSQPWALYYTIFITSLGSAIQGWDNTGANGANLSFPVEFGIADNTWLVGCINSAPTILGLMSAWLSDPVNNALGRRGAIFVTGLFCVFPVLGQAFTRNWWELLICRMLLGFGIGIKITTIPIFSSETVPASIRGGLVMSFQLWVAFGIFIGFCSNLIFYRIGPHAWRFQLAAAFAPAVPLLFLVWLCPESPRWLLKKRRFQQSFKSFCRLRNSELQAARDLYYAYRQLEAETAAFGGSTFFGRIRDIFVVPRLRRATLGAGVVMLAQQFSGINIMAFYSSTIFSEGGYSVRTSLFISFGFGLVNFAFAFPAIWTIDTFGRRNLLLFTFPNMAWSLFVVAGCFQLSVDNAARLPLIATFVFVFTAFYSPGIGPVPNVYAAECFPLSHRETGVAWAIFVNNTVSTILGLTFPSMLAAMKPTGAFCFYGGLNIVAFVMIFFGLPETKQRTLEELDYIFAVPTSRHASYQLNTWAPWFIKRYIFWQRHAHLEPLYQLDGVAGDGEPNKVDAFH